MKALPGAALLALSCLSLCPARGEERIVVTYSDRPPYLQPAGGGPPTGLTGGPGVAAFQAAGIAVTWRQLPTNRQLAMVKDPRGRSCALGWFRTPERERYAKFTKAIYRDKDWVLLARAGFTVAEDATLESVLQNRATRVLVKDNYSYGPHIDALMQRLPPSVAVSTGSTSHMLQSVGADSVDFMFVPDDEARYLLAQGGESTRNVRLLRLKDMPRGSERYIMCGKGVPDEVIERLNKVITFK